MVAPALIAAGITAAASLGGGLMSASGASAANAQNAALNYANQDMQRDINTANQTFQNNVNVKNWEMQEKANAQNFDFARDQTDKAFGFAREQTDIGQQFAREQMDFQERMSSSAYQRAMRDMRLAGLNPILAYQQGGSSSPGGAMGHPQSASPVGASASGASGAGVKLDAPKNTFSMENTQDELGRAIGRLGSSAVDAYRISKDADLKEQSTKLTGEQTKTEGQRHDMVQQQTGLTREQKFKTNAEIDNVRTQNAILRANASSAQSRARIDARSARDVDKHGSPYTPGTRERIFRAIGDYEGGPVSLPAPGSNEAF